MRVVGEPVARLDGLAKVTGQAQYTSDLTLPGMLYARLLRSTWPHARLTIDPARALDATGVRTVLYYANATDRPFSAADHDVLTTAGGVERRDQRPFPGVARYIGEPIAALAAESDVLAKEALALIEVDYDPLPAVLAVEDSREPAGA